MKVSEAIAQELNATLNKRAWGEVMYIVTVYNIVGDGTTDNTAKLQSLINEAISENRKAIFFPSGTYKVTTLTNADKVVFFGDNAKFVGGYGGTIYQLGEGDIAVQLNVKELGAAGDGVTDDYNAFFAAINAIPTAGSLIIMIPDGTYKITKPLYFTRTVKFQGNGMGKTILDFSSATAKVNAPYNCMMITVHEGNIPGGYHSSANPITLPAGQVGTYGLNTQICDLTIKGLNTANSHGLWLNAPSIAERVEIKNCGGKGFVIGANGTVDALAIKGNANHSKLNYCQAYQNGSHGFYIIGDDANTFGVTQCLTIANGGWGVYDDSLLGGVVIGCESDSNTSGSYYSNPGKPGRTVWLGNYSEGTNPVAYSVSLRNIIIGATGVQPAAGQPYFGGVVDKGFVTYLPFNVADTDQLAYDLGGTTGLATRITKGKIEIRPKIGSGIVSIGQAYSSVNYASLQVDNIDSIKIPLLDITGVVKKGVPYFDNGITLSGNHKQTAASAMPTSGSYTTGEIIWNDAPAVLGTAGSKYVVHGWRRITTGSGNVLNTDWVEMRMPTGT